MSLWTGSFPVLSQQTTSQQPAIVDKEVLCNHCDFHLPFLAKLSHLTNLASSNLLIHRFRVYILLSVLLIGLLVCLLLALDEKTICVGVARVGSDEQEIRVGSLTQMSSVDLGAPLHSLVIVGRTHPLERDLLSQFAIDQDTVTLINKA